ncbi:hypothetical protein ACIP6Q_39105 [Streptomyces bobili]|uniref:hypothetical protein n=1 Tax=Streptomyces bobili TaxID=67280 RepID=UPI003829BB0C
MPTLMSGEMPCSLQAADEEQYTGAYRPRGVPLHEVRRGPYDGTRAAVLLTNGEPPAQLSFQGGRFVYVLATVTDGHATYRYAPKLSALHRRLMDSVAEAYAEHHLRKGTK